MENRLEVLRAKIDKLIMEKKPEDCRIFFCHLYAVSKFCALLAIRRNLNPELAATSGMLHDIYQLEAGFIEHHAKEGAVEAEIILKELNLYTNEEIKIITTAISRHSNKKAVHEPYDEVLKDADVMSNFLYNIDYPIIEKEIVRHKNLLIELGC